MALFEKVINADGTETYKEVALKDVDIREHPDRQKLLDEAVKYRKRLKAALETATPQGETPSGEPPATTVPVVTPPPVIPTVDDVLTELEKRRKADAEAKAQEQQAWDTRVDAAMTKHSLPKAMRGVVANSRDPEAQAEALAKSGLTFADSPAGGDAQAEIEGLFAKVDKRLGFA